jgi:DNA-binding NarL/FixJ family response regulator
MPQPILAPGPAALDRIDPIRVLIAEGQGLVRAGYRALLSREDDLRVVAEVATVEQAVTAAQEIQPDVVLMDMALPGNGGVEATEQILADVGSGQVRVLMLMGFESQESVFGALRAGVTGLLLKDAAAGHLLEAIRVVASGEALLAPSIARRLIADFLSRPERLNANPERLKELTPREREVVGLVACGLSNHEIADRLVVSRATAKTHVSRALRKLDARDRAQLVVVAYEAGLVRPGPGSPDLPRALDGALPAASRTARAAGMSGTDRSHLRALAA